MTASSRWFRAALAAVGSFIATSCYYDPYASGAGYYGGSSYAGGSQLHTTFVYTSNERWLYDPSVYCYYDRHRRCYYDPYLYGYYPVGYCPRPLYGARHPGNWRPGSSCPPPSQYRDRHIPNYQNRLQQLQHHNHAWAGQARERNDAAVDAWRERRSRAASNYRETREPRPFQSHQPISTPSPGFQEAPAIPQNEGPRSRNEWAGFRPTPRPEIEIQPQPETVPVNIERSHEGPPPPQPAAPEPMIQPESVEQESITPAAPAPPREIPSEVPTDEPAAE